MRKKLLILLTLSVIVFLLTGCADPQLISQCVTGSPAGFWSGLWHGIILPFSFLGSLFSDKIAIYATYNVGGWYDFGYYLGVVCINTVNVSINYY